MTGHQWQMTTQSLPKIPETLIGRFCRGNDGGIVEGQVEEGVGGSEGQTVGFTWQKVWTVDENSPIIFITSQATFDTFGSYNHIITFTWQGGKAIWALWIWFKLWNMIIQLRPILTKKDDHWSWQIYLHCMKVIPPSFRAILDPTHQQHISIVNCIN